MVNYYLLTKPGIVIGNLITLAAGFFLAAGDAFPLGLFAATLFGLASIIASASVFNNYLDSPIDKKMARTMNRPLAKGVVGSGSAIAFALLLLLIGSATLFKYTNLLSLSIALLGFFIYVLLYSFWKRNTIYATAIGSIAGATPPVVGYCAVSNRLDGAAFILFFILFLWQMPHFFAISLWHYDDYERAELPLLAIKKGAERTKIHMLIYIISFLIATNMLAFYHYTGSLFAAVATSSSLIWLWYAIQGFKRSDNSRWGLQMFRISLLAIFAICLVIPFDKL